MSGITLLMGCEPGAMGTWPPRDQTGSQRLVSTPQTPPEEAPAGADPGNGVDARVQKYVAQFPPDDRDRDSAARPAPPPPSVAQAQPAQPKPAAAQQPGISNVTPPPQQVAAAAAQSPPPAASASTAGNGSSAMRAVAAEAPAPAKTETVASPQPADVVPPPAAGVSPAVEILDVRAASAIAATQPASGANQPTTPATQPSAADSLTSLIEQLEKSVAAHPQQLEDQLRLRLLYAATGQEEKATGAIAGVNPVQGDMLAKMLRAVVQGRRSMQDPVGAGPTALAALDELQRALAQQLPILIPKLAFVTRVNSFGDYDAVDPPQFTAGQPIHVFLYTEVSNFRTESLPEGRLHTMLAEKVEIFDASGKVIFTRSEPTIEDKTLSPRRDFFMTMEIQLPASLPAGEYVLKVTIEDKLGATTDQQRMTFNVGPKT